MGLLEIEEFTYHALIKYNQLELVPRAQPWVQLRYLD